jgi:SAM-dependent methyltransferase
MADEPTIRLDDPGWVRGQYGVVERLATRISVWRPLGGPTPQDVALRSLQDAVDVLEVGCGTGALASRIREQGGRVVATDLSPTMASKAHGEAIPSLAADVSRLPFADRSFDAAVAAWMLYHVTDVPTALGELNRVLRRGGRFVAVTIGNDHLSELWSAAGIRMEPPTFSRENGERLLGKFFDRVERHDLEAWADFPDREVAMGYLGSVGLSGKGMDAISYPLEVRGSPTVFVATKS